MRPSFRGVYLKAGVAQPDACIGSGDQACAKPIAASHAGTAEAGRVAASKALHPSRKAKSRPQLGCEILWR